MMCASVYISSLVDQRNGLDSSLEPGKGTSR